MLHAVGLEFDIEPAVIDETAIKNEYRRVGRDARSCAMKLAVAKACEIALRHPEALVIGADQLLVTGDEWLDKPRNLAEAGAQLRRLRGRSHVLVTAACAYQAEDCLWQASASPELTMRHFGEEFLTGYIAAEGAALLGSVGAYQLEGRGVQLFSRIAGDHFAILGLPLIELLGFLRHRGLLGE
jgi:septum formation protein